MKRILIMDDDPVLREVLRLMIETCGYRARVARHGDEAIEAYWRARASGSSYDAVMLDLHVHNGKGGKETIRKLGELAPDAKAIVMSGSIGDVEFTNFRQFGFRYALTKPFTIDDLKLALQSVAGGEAKAVEATAVIQGRAQ